MQVLIIDDEPALRELLAATLTRAGHAADEAGTAAEAAALARGDVDLALCDIKLGDGNGVDLLRNSRAAGIDHRFLMITAFASVETAVEALRAGAFDYLVKPVRNEADAPGGADRGGARPARREPGARAASSATPTRACTVSPRPRWPTWSASRARSRPPTARCSSRARAAPARA